MQTVVEVNLCFTAMIRTVVAKCYQLSSVEHVRVKKYCEAFLLVRALIRILLIDEQVLLFSTRFRIF